MLILLIIKYLLSFNQPQLYNMIRNLLIIDDSIENPLCNGYINFDLMNSWI